MPAYMYVTVVTVHTVHVCSVVGLCNQAAIVTCPLVVRNVMAATGQGKVQGTRCGDTWVTCCLCLISFELDHNR